MAKNTHALTDHDSGLVDAHDPDFNGRIVIADPNFSPGWLIESRVQVHPSPFEAFADPGSNLRAILTDAATENDGIGSSQQRQVGANVLLGALTEDLDGQFCIAIATPALCSSSWKSAVPERASKPDSVFSICHTCSDDSPLRFISRSGRYGSRSPDRLPETRPWARLKPMEVFKG